MGRSLLEPIWAAPAKGRVTGVAKLTSLRDAVSRLILDGETIYLAGFTHLIPFALGYEVIRQKKRNLVLARATPDLVCDQMIAAGCVSKVVYSWAGNPGVGLLRAFRRAVEGRTVTAEEYTHYAMVAMVAAGAARLPFFPIRSLSGSDLPRVNPKIRTVTDPYTGEVLHTVPALNPDVGVLHVQRSDAEGNSHVWGIVGEQKEVAFAARKLIITAEEIVDSSVIRSDPNRVIVPGFKVDAIVHVPWGAHPSYAQGYYDRDNAFYLEWDRISADEGRLADWLEEYVYACDEHGDYLAKIGLHRVAALRIPERLAAPVNYGHYGE